MTDWQPIALELLAALKALNKAFVGIPFNAGKDRMPALIEASRQAHAAVAKAEKELR